MLAYVLTYVLIIGSSVPIEVEVPGLRSVEHCRQLANEQRANLPRDTRMTRIACTRNGYLT